MPGRKLPQSDGPMVRLATRWPKALLEELRKAALAEGLSLNAFIVETFEAALAEAREQEKADASQTP